MFMGIIEEFVNDGYKIVITIFHASTERSFVKLPPTFKSIKEIKAERGFILISSLKFL